jgi:type II pantothenate kinase
MPAFCKLVEPEAYVAGDWDLVADPAGREAWLKIFDDHTTSLLEHARRSDFPPVEEACDAYELAFRHELEQIRARPEDYAPLTIYALCGIRARMMREHRIGDPYDRVKRVENEAALGHLPTVLRALDDCPGDTLVETLLRGLLAGNKFDLGAKETTEQHGAGKLDFFLTLGELGPRPWFVDDVDEIAERLAPGGCMYRKAMFFVDNAGGDVVLGAIPLARYLADNGCRVVLAANDEPSLNDITVDELAGVLAEIEENHDARVAGHVKSGVISIVGTGCDCPLIDLADVSEECNAAAADADLVILEGMGRAVESNYRTPLSCDCIRVAMIKNRSLAQYLGCRLFDLVAGFTLAV